MKRTAAAVLITLWSLVFAWTGLVAANGPPPPGPNDVEFWCPIAGVKIEPASTPFVVPAPPDGFTWTLLVLKAGSEQSADPVNELFPNPVVGQSYSRTDGKGISHAILCKVITTTTTSSSTTTSSTTTTTVPDTTTSTTTTVPETTTSSSTTTSTTSTTTSTVPETTISTTTTVGTTTTGATVPPTTTIPQETTTSTTVGTTTTTEAVAADRAIVVAEDVEETTTTAPPNTLPVTGGNAFLAFIGTGLIGLGGLASLLRRLSW